MKLFLSLSADTSIRDNQGKTAMEVALSAKHQSTCCIAVTAD